MANGAMICKNPPAYPMMSKIQAAEAAVPPSPIGKLCKQAPEPAIPELTKDAAPQPLRKGKCGPVMIECGPFPGPKGRIGGIDVGPQPLPPGAEIPGGGCFPPQPVNIRDEIRKSIQICPSRGPNGEAVWPTGEQIDTMVDDILKSRMKGGEAKGVSGDTIELKGKRPAAHGCHGRMVSHEHARQGSDISQAVKGQALGTAIGVAHAQKVHATDAYAKPLGRELAGEAHAQKMHATDAYAKPLGQALSGEAHARPTGRGGLEPIAEPQHAKPLNAKRLDSVNELIPAPKGNEYYFYQQRKQMEQVNELAKPLAK